MFRARIRASTVLTAGNSAHKGLFVVLFGLIEFATFRKQVCDVAHNPRLPPQIPDQTTDSQCATIMGLRLGIPALLRVQNSNVGHPVGLRSAISNFAMDGHGTLKVFQRPDDIALLTQHQCPVSDLNTFCFPVALLPMNGQRLSLIHI